MGDRDPAVARENTPTALRALYGKSLEQNGLMGSPDVQTAEVQIASLFASSPIFPTHELPDEVSDPSVANQFPEGSLASSILSSLQRTTSDGYAPSSATNPSTTTTSRLNPNGKPTFRARAVPSTNVAPDIAPRTTKAAALRAGIVYNGTRGPRVAPTREQQKQNFMDVPGHKRSTTIAVASTAAPTIAPRMTKAAALRQGIKPAPKLTRQVSSTSSNNSETFDGVPGHKRRETISVLSTRTPTVGPRLNKSAALRAEKEKAPPTSYQCKWMKLFIPLPTSLTLRLLQSDHPLPELHPDQARSPVHLLLSLLFGLLHRQNLLPNPQPNRSRAQVVSKHLPLLQGQIEVLSCEQLRWRLPTPRSQAQGLLSEPDGLATSSSQWRVDPLIPIILGCTISLKHAGRIYALCIVPITSSDLFGL